MHGGSGKSYVSTSREYTLEDIRNSQQLVSYSDNYRLGSIIIDK